MEGFCRTRYSISVGMGPYFTDLVWSGDQETQMQVLNVLKNLRIKLLKGDIFLLHELMVYSFKKLATLP